MITVRPATSSDLEAITEIYNESILTTTATFDTQPKTLAEQEQWFNSHGDRRPVFVAEVNGRVVGWASLSEWSDRCAYSDTAEISLYVRENLRGQGAGKALMKAVLEAGEKAGVHTVIARIAEGNTVSVSLHESFGFESVGVMREVGKKFGRLLDVYLMQKIFGVSRAREADS
jgi:phosphinothricin acetyltransferase